MITGFSSPAQGYEENGINLNNLLIKHPNATSLMKVESDKYIKNGIYNGDLLIIDRAKPINPNSLVVYESEGQFTIGRVYSIASEAIITGAIIHVIHTVKET